MGHIEFGDAVIRTEHVASFTMDDRAYGSSTLILNLQCGQQVRTTGAQATRALRGLKATDSFIQIDLERYIHEKYVDGYWLNEQGRVVLYTSPELPPLEATYASEARRIINARD